jgi:geranylgeranyl diphosphate synthase type I
MNKTTKQEEITEQLLTLLEKRGRKALELARKIVLEEKIESKEVQDALKYFMTEYWHDVTRAGLLSLVCEAVGGDTNLTTPIAVPLILISGAIDIHDDIIDESTNKESQLTVFGKFGKDIALLVGDILMFKGFTVLYKAVEEGIPAEQIAVISDIMDRTFFELGDAEALELQFRGRTDVTPEVYLRVVRKKAADVEAYTRISALVGGGSEEEIEALGEYGRLLGMLVILRDDMIDMIDLEETLHRIKNEHLSLVIVYALQKPEIKSKLSQLLKKTVTTKDAEKILMVVNEAGGFVRMEECMNELAENAYKKVEMIQFNRNQLALMVQGMLLPEWRSYLAP